VTQQKNLGGHGRIVAGQQRQPGQNVSEDQVDQRQRHTHSTTINAARLAANYWQLNTP